MVLPKKFYIYIVRCADGTYYTGKTGDVAKRLLQHNGKLGNGAKYTRTRRPVELVFSQECSTNILACQRETKIKQMSRKQKETLINGHV